MEEEVDEYDKTLIWALEEEKTRINRGKGIAPFYLIISSLVILLILCLILYFTNKEKKSIGALEMMKDPNNIFDDFSEEVELIDLSEEEEKPIIEEAKEIIEEAKEIIEENEKLIK